MHESLLAKDVILRSKREDAAAGEQSNTSYGRNSTNGGSIGDFI